MITHLAPFVRDFRTYSVTAFRSDLLAGAAVALFAVPQAMAYAMLAGVVPIYGLYAAVVMSIVAALWGSSPYVNTGPTNSAALLTAAAIAPFALVSDHMAYIATLCLMVGVVRLAMGLARFGSLLDFVPESAFLGFTVGAGLLIGMGQLHHLLGVAAPEASWFPARMVETLEKFPAANPSALIIGLITVGIMLLFNHRSKKFPVALFAIGLSGLAAWLLNGDFPVRTVHDVAAIPSGLPAVSMPLFDIHVIKTLLPASLAIAVIGLIEAASIGQTLALRRGERLDVNQEFIGQGLSQIAGSFLSSIPGSGSFSRSLLMEASGGVTRFANVFFGLVTMGALMLIPRLLEWIPVSALAGLLIYIGIKLVDVPRIRRVFATSASDSGMLIITLLVTVFYRIEFGIFAGIVGAALIHLHRTRELQLVEYIPSTAGRITELPYGTDALHAPSEIVALGISGDLYYGVSSALRNQLNDIIEAQHPRHLVLRMRRAYSIDYSCWSVLFDIAEHLEQKGGHLYLCGIRPDFQTIISQAGMQDGLPPDRIFPATDSPFQAFDRCLSTIVAANGLSDARSENWRLRTVSPDAITDINCNHNQDKV
jgi:sulfate permease, SulP family